MQKGEEGIEWSLGRAFGEEVRARRSARDLSQEELSEYADLDRNSVGVIERGKGNPSLRTMSRLARALEASLSDLMLAAEERLSCVTRAP